MQGSVTSRTTPWTTGVHVYYGSRTAQPSRVRALIDVTVERLAHSTEYVLDASKLAMAELKGRRKSRRRY